MPGKRRDQALPVEGSWRMVEGEHESFDTSIVPDQDDPDLVFSSNPSQYSPGSGLGDSQERYSIGGSQDDDIHSFLSKAGDERVILRSPFAPSVPANARQSGRRREAQNRSPDPEFVMPRVAVDGDAVVNSTGRSPPRRYAGGRDTAGLRQRQGHAGSPSKRRGEHHQDEPQPATFAEQFLAGLLRILSGTFDFIITELGLALRYARKPLAFLLAIYLLGGALIITKNMLTNSITSAVAPLCSIPGASFLPIPFCADIRNSLSKRSRNDPPVEFGDLMKMQANFESILEKSAAGVTLPMEMKRSESSVRDLRTLVSHSDLPAKGELIYEFDGFVEAIRAASGQLQRFNIKVGGAVDSVISINRWTTRSLDALARQRELEGTAEKWAKWVFRPFSLLSSDVKDPEWEVRVKYVAHTSLVSEKIASLIVEANAVLRELNKAEDHLALIYDFTTRTGEEVRENGSGGGRHREDILWALWAKIVGNKEVGRINRQLALLVKVEKQRVAAVQQVSDLLVELQKIEAGLGDLRDKIAEPEAALLRTGEDGSYGEPMPMRVHIETINTGVERLESARKRIRAMEDAEVQAVINRGSAQDGRLIEGS